MSSVHLRGFNYISAQESLLNHLRAGQRQSEPASSERLAESTGTEDEAGHGIETEFLFELFLPLAAGPHNGGECGGN